MKIKDGYILKNIAGSFVVISLLGNSNENSVISLNETGSFLWKLIENGADEKELLSKLCSEYDVDKTRAENDIGVFINKMKELDVLE